jgi:hypothetical protein
MDGKEIHLFLHELYGRIIHYYIQNFNKLPIWVNHDKFIVTESIQFLNDYIVDVSIYNKSGDYICYSKYLKNFFDDFYYNIFYSYNIKKRIKLPKKVLYTLFLL